MLDFLTQYAIQNVWCSPYQDLQAIIQLRRATPVGGRRSYFEYGRQRYSLPDATNFYHIYSLGQTSPLRLNLPRTQGNWIAVSEVCKERNLLIDLYFDDGRQIPRSLSYMFRTEDKTYLLAVPVLRVLPSLDTQHLFMRFYSNAYYTAAHRPVGEPGIDIQGGLIESAAQGLALQQAYHLALEGPGHAYAFHNGVYVTDFIPNSYVLGDVLEWVYDPSIKEVVDFPYDSLQTFTSTMDSTQKFLLHPPKSANDQILYCDDVDVFVVNRVGNRDVGAYVHKNVVDTLRMVTHNDYSLKVSHVESLRASFPTWVSTTTQKVRLHIRQGGYSRGLVPEARSLNELYSLSDEQILGAVVGLDSTIPEWRAAALEASLYTRFMGSVTPLELRESVPQMFGYNAITALVGTPLVPVVAGVASVPLNYQNQGTAYEYGADGVLKGFRTYTAVDTYVPFYPEVTQVEFYSGLGVHDQDYTYSTDVKVLNPAVGYRFYVSSLVEGVSDGKWVDVTGDVTKYTVTSDGTVVWGIDQVYQIGLVKGDSTFHGYVQMLPNSTLTYELTLTQADGFPIPVLPGKVELWLNGHSLVEDVDYHGIGNRFVIVNKTFLKTDGNPQEVTIRGTGFCDTTMLWTKATEIGFVKHECLSVDNYYNVRSNRPLRVVVGGRIYDPKSVDYEEDQSAISPLGVVNGQPFSIDNVLVPLRGLTAYDTFALRPSAVDFDKRLGNYLNAKLPTPQWPESVPIPGRYTVVSPVVARILADLETGVLVPPITNASGQAIDIALGPYKHLIPFDPCVRGYDDDYVVVIAHPRPTFIDVSLNGYVFLERVIKDYLRGEVDLTPTVRIV